MGLWNASEHSFEENSRWSYLRAVEWKALPAFLSQPIVPLLLLKFHWYQVVIYLLVGGLITALIWHPLRWRLVNIGVASATAIFVNFTRWPFAIIAACILIFRGEWIDSIFALVNGTGAIAGYLPGLFFAGGAKGIGDFEVKFMRNLGYEMPDLSVWK